MINSRYGSQFQIYSERVLIFDLRSLPICMAYFLMKMKYKIIKKNEIILTLRSKFFEILKIHLIYRILYLERILLCLRKLISIETYRIYLYDYDEVQRHYHETLLHLFLSSERFGLTKQLQNGFPRKYVDQQLRCIDLIPKILLGFP